MFRPTDIFWSICQLISAGILFFGLFSFPKEVYMFFALVLAVSALIDLFNINI
jgi:hypothetical protein